MAAQISIQCKSLPPIKLPRVLVSLGRIISVFIQAEAEGVFGFMLQRYASHGNGEFVEFD